MLLMRARASAVAGALMFTAAAVTAGGVPEYSAFELQARSNFAGAYNLPDTTFFSNATGAIADDGSIAFKLSVVAGTQGQSVWHGGGGAGGIVYTSPNTVDSSITDPSLNGQGQIVVDQYFTSPSGVVLIDTAAMTSGVAYAGPYQFHGAVHVSDTGVIGFRGRYGSNAQEFVTVENGVRAVHVAEVGAQPGSPYSFLFTPSFNNLRQVAGKARRGGPGQVGNSQPDEVRIWNVDGSSVLIAEDRDADPASPFTAFDNSVALSDTGLVAFNANLAVGGRGVFVGDGATVIEIATTNGPAISDLEFFGPAINDGGLVAFRAFDARGLRAVWAGDGSGLVRVVGEHDLIDSDLGTARIDQNATSSPVFGGGVSINARGDIVFNCGLTPPDNNQVEWGSGFYVAYASAGVEGDLDGDGAVSGSDLAVLLGFWGPCATGACSAADLDGDGEVGGSDLAVLLGAWTP